MIRFENTGISYDNGESWVLRHFEAHIREGEFILLTGPSGVGKTSLIKLILREMLPREGRVIVDREDITKLPDQKIPYYRRRLGVIFQDFRLIRSQSVFDNLNISRRIYGWRQKESEQRIMHVLKFLGMDHMHRRLPDELSGGEQQKICLARAILNDPKILLADEPTRNLDPRTSREFAQLLELIHRQGTTIVMATHDAETVKKEAENVRELTLSVQEKEEEKCEKEKD